MKKENGQSGWLGRHPKKASGGWHSKSLAASSQPLELAEGWSGGQLDRPCSVDTPFHPHPLHAARSWGLWEAVPFLVAGPSLRALEGCGDPQ